MTALADTPLSTAPTEPARSTGGSKPLAVATVAAPVLLAAGVSVHPDDTQGVEKTLELIAGDASAMWTFVHLVEPFAWALLGVTMLLALPRMAGVRGRTLLKVAGVLSMIGHGSVALIVYGHGETYRFMAQTLSDGVEPSAYGPLFESFEKAMPLAAFPSLLGRIGLVLAIVGLIRARTVPVWAALMLLAPVLLMGSGSWMPLPLAAALFFGPMVVTSVFLARRVARTGGPALG